MTSKRARRRNAVVKAPASAPCDGGTPEGLSGLFDQVGAAICICDERDRIVYMNDLFRRALMPLHKGEKADFATALVDNIVAGRGVRLDSVAPSGFAATVRERRHRQSGSISFTTEAVDGRWWLVTDSKLDNGWMIAVGQDVTAIKHTELQLRHAHSSALEDAETDFLTRAPNRRAGLSRAQDLFAKSQSAGGALAIALLDVDHFKLINDIHGHAIGDAALVHLTDVLMRSIGPQDLFSRIGGEEFLVVSADLDLRSLQDLLAGILRPFPPLALSGGAELRLTVSAGVAAALPDESWDDLIHRADRALYDAKAKGRNRIERAQSAVADRHHRRVASTPRADVSPSVAFQNKAAC